MPEDVANGAVQGVLVAVATAVLMVPAGELWDLTRDLAILPMTYVLMRRYVAGAGRLGLRGVPVVLALLVLQVVGTMMGLQWGDLVGEFGWNAALNTFSAAPFANVLANTNRFRWTLVNVALGGVVGLVPPRTLFRLPEF